ncbi:PilZ domain-containing protein [Desulfobulbus alkaliphilus]|uniref:PilZ domain-containing protein n=1 Tax=Desulfobulbus alkaliphilus TaxID=869814 RepID=UPI0019650A24|nr:PilZ domain-containing protein [Desulfobulbus alkaliphilus]
MARIDDILSKLDNGAPTVVDIPGKRDEVFRCDALLVKKEAPGLELIFSPNAWQLDDLQLGANCPLAVEHNGRHVNLIARLDGANGDRRLLFTAREPIAPETLRDFFRVGINTTIEAQYLAGPREINNRSWKISGTTIDLSGSGVLALFPEKPPSNKHIQLNITVPEEEQPIICLANVVRTYRVRKNRYQVAFHFENISAKARDQLISCCFQEQRRQLRENVRTL